MRTGAPTPHFSISRRALFGAAAAGTGAFLARGAVAGLPAGEVVGFHADAPWLDPSGRDIPYFAPPLATASAQDAEALARLGHYF